MELLSPQWMNLEQLDREVRSGKAAERLRERAARRAEKVQADQRRLMASRDEDWRQFQALAKDLDAGSVELQGDLLHAHAEDDNVPLYYLNAKTKHGRQLLFGVPLSCIHDAQSSPYREERRAWSWGVGNREPQSPDDRQINSAEEILEAVKSHGDVERMRRGVLMAEVAAFNAVQAKELLSPLKAYIERFYTTKEEAVLTAVGAAVRTYIAVLPIEELDGVAGLLASQPPMPSPLENEIAKMIVRKLTATPPEKAGTCPSLANQLADTAEAYMHPKWLLRECYSPAAMNASTSVALLLADRLDGIREEIRARCPDWFQQQLGRRAARISEELSRKYPEDRIAAHKAALLSLSDTAG